MVCGIYMIENKNTGQKYIGQSVDINRRYREHIRGINISHSYIDDAIQKYGINNFNFSIILKLPQDKELLNEMEKYYIWKYNTYLDKKHYNLTIGGESSPTLNSDVAKKISQKQKGKNNSFYGHKHSEEQKKKWSLQRKGNKFYKNNKHPFLNKKRPEHSKKMTGKNNPMYNKKGKNSPFTKYFLWDSSYCSYIKREMERNGREPNPCKCFQFKYKQYRLPIGMFIDFVSCEILNELIYDQLSL